MDMPLCSGKWVRDNLLILDDLFTTTDLLYFYRFYGLTLQATSRLGLKLFDITKSNELKIRTVYEIRIKMRLFSIFRTAVLYKYRCHSLAPFLTCRQGRRRSQLAEAAVPERYATLVSNRLKQILRGGNCQVRVWCFQVCVSYDFMAIFLYFRGIFIWKCLFSPFRYRHVNPTKTNVTVQPRYSF